MRHSLRNEPKNASSLSAAATEESVDTKSSRKSSRSKQPIIPYSSLNMDIDLETRWVIKMTTERPSDKGGTKEPPSVVEETQKNPKKVISEESSSHRKKGGKKDMSLSGENTLLLSTLEVEMKDAALAEDFELAGQLKRQCELLRAGKCVEAIVPMKVAAFVTTDDVGVDDIVAPLSCSEPKKSSKQASAKKKSEKGAGAKEKIRKKKDPNAPKGPKTAFNLFSADKRDGVKKDNPTATFGELSAKLSAAWKVVPEEEKRKFGLLAEEDKERHKRDMVIYNEIKAELEADAAGEDVSDEEDNDEADQPKKMTTKSKKKKSIPVKRHIPLQDEEEAESSDDEEVIESQKPAQKLVVPEKTLAEDADSGDEIEETPSVDHSVPVDDGSEDLTDEEIDMKLVTPITTKTRTHNDSEQEDDEDESSDFENESPRPKATKRCEELQNGITQALLSPSETTSTAMSFELAPPVKSKPQNENRKMPRASSDAGDKKKSKKPKFVIPSAK